MAAPMEIRLWNDKREREMYDSFADLYAILKTMEKLEKAYVRDLVGSAEYEAECLKLIAQFRTLTASLAGAVPSVDRFAEAYRIDCPAALHRLVTAGVPATVEHRSQSASASGSAASAAVVAECVQHFITAMDSLKLNMVAVDQVHPLLSDLSSSLLKLGANLLPPDFEGKVKLKEWIARLAKMRAADELTEQQARQLLFDLESSYNAFMAVLSTTG
ncbi:putative vacuolar protein sorting-associated Vps28 [Dioscorea sansibarensis]